MAKPLVIVESPAKAKTISKFLGSEFLVESSIGHIRDLPKSASEIPDSLKKEPWARLGVDVENSFKPLYVISDKKKAHIKHLKSLVSQASEVLLATDEDREGESIAWHLAEVLAPKVPIRRMVFHEITKSAISQAIENTRDIDQQLVSAQEARRILDRLYGYEVSPVLWKKIKPSLSAGRVQSVATRILVQRERERMAFVSAGYFSVMANATKAKSAFRVNLIGLDSLRVATGRDFSSAGSIDPARIKNAPLVVLDEPSAILIASDLKNKSLLVESVEPKPYRRSPAPPFRTSTLQQEAGRKLRFSSTRTMSAAQRLYEAGFITYMRTDSTYLADAALVQTREIVKELYGNEFVPARARDYKNSVKNAQEAHEAIRPAGDQWLTPAQITSRVSSDEARLYELIWKRTIASQMTDATGTSVSVRLSAPLALDQSIGSDQGARLNPTRALLSASGRTIDHFGFLRVYVEDSDDGDTSSDENDVILPPLVEGEAVPVLSTNYEGHTTSPPPRFTEASLVKTLEEYGVGRPSTYASIISTIQDRGYAFKRGNTLIPSFVAFSVVALLEQYFGELVDYNFTAELENSLDKIANGDIPAVPYLRDFYFGANDQGLKFLVDSQLDAIDPRAINSISIGDDEEGNPIVVRVGRFGPYLSVGDTTAPVPDGIAPDELTTKRAIELLAAGSGDRFLGLHPEIGDPIFVKVGRFGPFIQLGDPELLPKGEKPKTGSLFSTMTPETVTLEDAVSILSLPRIVGRDPETGDDVVVSNGKFGPYVKRGRLSRSLTSESQLLSIGLEDAVAILAQPATGRGRRTATSIELGVDPDGRSIVLRSGRFGPYVSDGTINCTVKQFEVDEGLTMERAVELLAEKRGSMPEVSNEDGEGVKPKKRTTRSTAKATSTAKGSTRSTGARVSARAPRATTPKTPKSKNS
ncbi:type I DNA topoisomerase [Acidithrix sp. C25]|uniref:type I DNA topoisomerase n=1 Tax=Acidithrix sp. C25 TaxID=1671482 RepID=UPI00191B9F3D|nr:type I DNA topoisomerase [Acidithrix sp. C25]CAG4917539.1 unnamed protein product [Acidithrix sp. C25]